MEIEKALWMYECSFLIAEIEIRLCKNIAKFFCKICLFEHAKLCILDGNFEIFFSAKNRRVSILFHNRFLF